MINFIKSIQDGLLHEFSDLYSLAHALTQDSGLSSSIIERVFEGLFLDWENSKIFFEKGHERDLRIELMSKVLALVDKKKDVISAIPEYAPFCQLEVKERALLFLVKNFDFTSEELSMILKVPRHIVICTHEVARKNILENRGAEYRL